MIVETFVTKQTTLTKRLYRKDLLLLLKDVIPAHVRPLDITICVEVPGGGNWSGMNLEMDDVEVPLIVRCHWKEDSSQ